MDEMIIVAPRRELFSAERDVFHGFLPLSDARVEAILRGLCLAPRHARRGDVEEDPSLKQPIPYVVLSRRGEGGEPELFAYTRLTGGGEARLHGKMSVGVGGHMNRVFTRETLETVVWEEAARELEEELCFEGPGGEAVAPPSARFAGLINDDGGPVQQVHLGLLALTDVPAGITVTVRETDQLEGHWVPLSDLRRPALFDRLESWSQYALEAID
jgi:predicted NUDIX family phosphoesterase